MTTEKLVIVGAGFAGLCAAFHGRASGLDPLIIDCAEGPGGAWARMNPDMLCLSPRKRDLLPDTTMPGGAATIATAGAVLAQLRAFADKHAFRALYRSKVTVCARDGDEFVLRIGDSTLRTSTLVAATGVAGAPRGLRASDPFEGNIIPTLGLHQQMEDVGDKVLVVGAGNSGAEAVRLLRTTGRQVTLSSRAPLRSRRPPMDGLLGELRWQLSGTPTQWLPRSLRCQKSSVPQDEALEKAAADGSIHVVGEAVSFTAAGAICRTDVGFQEVEVDTIICATGYRRDLDWLDSLLPRDPGGTPRHRAGLIPETPKLALLGLDCQRTRRSGFLRGMNDDAHVIVRRLVGHGHA